MEEVVLKSASISAVPEPALERVVQEPTPERAVPEPAPERVAPESDLVKAVPESAVEEVVPEPAPDCQDCLPWQSCLSCHCSVFPCLFCVCAHGSVFVIVCHIIHLSCLLVSLYHASLFSPCLSDCSHSPVPHVLRSFMLCSPSPLICQLVVLTSVLLFFFFLP